MKKCNKCNKIKDDTDFYTQRRTTKKGTVYYSLRYLCIPCDKRQSYKRRKDHGWKHEKAKQYIGSKHHELSKKLSQKHRDEMSDMYIRSLITKKWDGMKSEDIPQDMVEAYRVSLALKRELKKTLK